VARRSRRPSFLENLSAVFIAGVILVTMVLHVGLGVAPEDAARLAVVGVAAMLSVSVLSMAATMARQAIHHQSRRRAAKKPIKGRHRVPRGLIRRIDRRAGKRIRQYGAHLARKRNNCWNPDAPGKIDQAKWIKEQDDFIDDILLEGVREPHRTAILRRNGLVAGWRRRIEAAVNEHDHDRASAGAGLDFRPGMDGFEYEAYCARVLTEAGWKVWNKGDTGDQGVDLVAERRDMIVAIQCKRYRSAVGNSAVQEIFAGRLTVSPKAYAAVCSNAEYTRSAKELAETTGVYLLQHDDLPKLHDLIARHADPLKEAA
jgi:hypothetical protein